VEPERKKPSKGGSDKQTKKIISTTQTSNIYRGGRLEENATGVVMQARHSRQEEGPEDEHLSKVGKKRGNYVLLKGGALIMGGLPRRRAKNGDVHQHLKRRGARSRIIMYRKGTQNRKL